MKTNFKFLKYFFLTIFCLIIGVFSLNNLIDPLWYNNGNKLKDINYSWDERSQILNRFFKIYKKNDINCLIFGSSTSTIINVKNIKNYKCINFSFSAGSLDEFELLLLYLKKYIEPEVIIIEINFNLPEKKNPKIDKLLPNYIFSDTKKNRFVNYLKDYLSLKCLIFSIKSILDMPNLLNAYDKNFEPFVLKDKAKKYKNYINLSLKKEPNEIFFSNAKTYQKLQDLYPSTFFIGFIHPFHPKYPINRYKSNNLDNFISTAHSISENFDRFYDFSLPSEINFNPENTYDGSHYYSDVYKLVVDKIFEQEKINYGYRVVKFKEYKEKYIGAILKYNEN
tara:strand:+ start:1578 stop:2588 length:1011 start_codon:yes stop_codon:yes gene_type:complete